MKPGVILISGLLMLGGCGEPPSPPPPYQATLSIHEFMVWYLEPAADVIWDSAGFVLTAEGEVDLQPTTQEGWDHVRNSAAVVAEAGNLLMMPGYAAPGDWQEYAEGMIGAANLARDAAIAQDADALFDAGGLVYNVCRSCHNKYMVEGGADGAETDS